MLRSEEMHAGEAIPRLQASERTLFLLCEHWTSNLGSAAAHYLVYVLSGQGQRDEENWFV